MTQSKEFRTCISIAIFLWIVVGIMTCNKAYGQAAKGDFKIYSKGDTVKPMSVSPNFIVFGSGKFNQPTVRRTPDGIWHFANDTLALEMMYRAFMQVDSAYQELKEGGSGCCSMQMKQYKSKDDNHVKLVFSGGDTIRIPYSTIVDIKTTR